MMLIGRLFLVIHLTRCTLSDIRLILVDDISRRGWVVLTHWLVVRARFDSVCVGVHDFACSDLARRVSHALERTVVAGVFRPLPLLARTLPLLFSLLSPLLTSHTLLSFTDFGYVMWLGHALSCHARVGDVAVFEFGLFRWRWVV